MRMSKRSRNSKSTATSSHRHRKRQRIRINVKNDISLFTSAMKLVKRRLFSGKLTPEEVELVCPGAKLEVLEKGLEARKENVYKQARRANFLNHVMDLEDIQSQLDELRENFLKERAALVAIYDAAKSQHDENEAKLIAELEAIEAKYHTLYKVQHTKRQADEVTKHLYEKITSLDDKYYAMREPLYAQRSKVVNDVVDMKGLISEADANSSMAKTRKGVPDFWLTAMKADPVLSEEITERDEEVLKFVKDITLGRNSNRKSFHISFWLEKNPFYDDEALLKSYSVPNEDNEDYQVPELEFGIKMCRKCLVPLLGITVPRKGPKHFLRGGGECASFLNFFEPYLPLDNAEELLSRRVHDFKIGCAIANLIPNAISYFIKGTDLEDMYEDDDDEHDLEDMYEDDGEEEDDDDDDKEEEEDDDNDDEEEDEEEEDEDDTDEEDED